MAQKYAGELTIADHCLGHKMDELNLFENTLLLLLSDHGVAHGEHGYTGKLPYVLWPGLTDIPFLIRYPGSEGSGETSDYYASTHGVAPTILGFLGIEPPKPMDGEDLSVIFDGGEPKERGHFTLGYNDHAWARDEQYVMFAKNGGTRATQDYVLEDVGVPLPHLDA